MVEDLLKAEAAAVQRQLADHDPAAFMRKLARRIAEASEASDASDASGASERAESGTGAGAPAADRAVRGSRAPAPVRPLARRHTHRRRPVPIVRADPSCAPDALTAELRQLCDTVLRSNEIHTLADFAADYDAAGARTFGCLLYSLGRDESALYWWRFAAGAEDELAAHLLAVHHAAVGFQPDARLWRTVARMLGFSVDRHLPQPVRSAAELAQGFARTVTHGSTLERFLKLPHLPGELVAG
ncbi:hypothetical protein [Streptomyces gobiensis]|uniref:hypothetical protein n=1 Tax=Streptomyces gobiensis TaxID=2875706 RepID=UPI001E389A52|nr:hypothetical protein [Streptomyces gobiensis]UGY93081.1 hypothetical protein test1122_16105 [Streptomyces gobiensis]